MVNVWLGAFSSNSQCKLRISLSDLFQVTPCHHFEIIKWGTVQKANLMPLRETSPCALGWDHLCRRTLRLLLKQNSCRFLPLYFIFTFTCYFTSMILFFPPFHWFGQNAISFPILQTLVISKFYCVFQSNLPSWHSNHTHFSMTILKTIFLTKIIFFLCSLSKTKCLDYFYHSSATPTLLTIIPSFVKIVQISNYHCKHSYLVLINPQSY